MSMIQSNCTLLGASASVRRGTARCRTVRSIEYKRHGSAMTANPIHSRMPALGVAAAIVSPLVMTGVLHKGLESIGGRVPLRGDAIAVLPRDLESLRIEREHALAPTPRLAPQAQPHRGLEMTRDLLTADAGT